MKKELYVHIPTPCHEDWQQMTPVDKGRFCQSCAKQVVDFSVMSDQEVLNYLSKASGNLCGRFANDQLQRPLQPIREEKKKIWWMAAMVPVLMLVERGNAQKKDKTENAPLVVKLSETVSGMVSYDDGLSYEELGDHRTLIKKVTVQRQKGDSIFCIEGRVVDERNNVPMPYASVVIKDSKTGTVTDQNGNFKLTGSAVKNHVEIQIMSVGFEVKELSVSLKDSVPAPTESSHIIKGKVIDTGNGDAIPFASIKVKGTNQICTTDTEGRFSIPVAAPHINALLIISSVGFEDREVPVSLKDTDSITIKCSPHMQGLTEIVVTAGKMAYCEKPKKTDTIPALIRKVFHKQPFKAYPNPATRGGSVTIEARSEGLYSIQLFDNSGKLLQVKAFEAVKGGMQTSIVIPISASAGIYHIRLVDDKTKKQYTDKIVVM